MELQSCVEDLYAAFADVPKPSVIEGCPCCYENKQVDVLLATPIRELAPEIIDSYAFSAFKTIGAVADYLYFLPRILEISVTEEGWWPDVEITGRSIQETQPLHWRKDRLEALQALFKAKVADYLTRTEDVYWESSALHSWLCAIGRSGMDIRPYLQLIESSPAYMEALYSDNAEDLAKGKLVSGFWEKSDLSHAVMVAWLTSPPVRAAVYDRAGIIIPPSD